MTIGSNHRKVRKRWAEIGIAVEFVRRKRDDTPPKEPYRTGENMSTITFARPLQAAIVCAVGLLAVGYVAVLITLSLGAGGL
jgi:hypothetical protein